MELVLELPKVPPSPGLSLRANSNAPMQGRLDTELAPAKGSKGPKSPEYVPGAPKYVK